MRLPVLDSLRGLLLIQMTFDHMGRPFSKWLFQCFGFFSAAECFFFLSGLVGAWAVLRKQESDPGAAFLRRRARTVWLAHVLSVLGFAIVIYVLQLRIPSGFGAYADHPVAATALTALLLHTPAWFDVLALYALFMLVASYLFPLMARNHVWPLALSVLLWSGAQLGLRAWSRQWLPDWAAADAFDPFAWQFAYFLGAGVGFFAPAVRRFFSTFALRLLMIGTVGAAIFFFCWSHGWLPLEKPSLWWISRHQLGPFRLLSFLVFAGSVALLVRSRPGWLDFRPARLLGKHSLPIFVWQSLLVQFWFMAPAALRSHPWNAVFSLLAVGSLFVPAGLAAWKQRRKCLPSCSR